MSDTVKSIEIFTLTLKKDTPYLGAIGEGEDLNDKGYFVRKANKTVYPSFDRSILLKIETSSGIVGWGETYGLVAPGVVYELITDLLANFIIGRDPSDPSAIYDNLYDLMRVRGYTGGFYVDTLAAIDIALWDIAGRQIGKSVSDLLGGAKRREFMAYISGLPEPTIEARGELALSWQQKGFNSFKFAAPVADCGLVEEIAYLRSVLGPTAKISADMHWNHTADNAIRVIQEMAKYDIWFAEAPVRTEDISGLEKVSKNVSVPIAVGEEWRTHFDMLHRVERCKIAIVQPEMGHKGITNFVRIGELAAELNIDFIPHATIGAGIFLAASLQVSACMEALIGHEFQHSVFEPNRWILTGNMECNAGFYTPPSGPGLGVEPSPEALQILQRL